MKTFYNFYRTKANTNVFLFNIKVHNYFFNNKFVKNKSSNLKTNLNYLNNLNLFMKSGLKLKINSLFFNYFKHFFNLFFFKNTNIQNYNYFNEIKSAIFDNYNLKNFNNLFNWYFNYFNFMFNIKNKIAGNSQSKKKNSVKNTTIKLLFVIKNKRNLYFFKWLKKLFYINYSNNLKKTFFYLLNDVFLNFKNSQMYKYKISMYKTFLLS